MWPGGLVSFCFVVWLSSAESWILQASPKSLLLSSPTLRKSYNNNNALKVHPSMIFNTNDDGTRGTGTRGTGRRKTWPLASSVAENQATSASTEAGQQTLAAEFYQRFGNKQRPDLPLGEGDDADAIFMMVVGLYQSLVDKGQSSDIDLLLASQLLEKVFKLDFEAVQRQQFDNSGTRLAKNVTCLRPDEDAIGADESNRMFEQELMALKTKPGRVCTQGNCCSSCSRVILPKLASNEEVDRLRSLVLKLMPPSTDETHSNLYLKFTAAAGVLEAHLLYIRLVERMRRTLAFEYGLPLDHVSPRQTFVSRITSRADPTDYSVVHVDEASTRSYHYSCVLYLTEPGDFQGGEFVFTDHDPHGGNQRVLTRVQPRKGQAVMFSSGWENVHYVDAVTQGERVAIPTFFTTEKPLTSLPWNNKDATQRARAFFEMGVYPSNLDDFLTFMQHWSSHFAPDLI